MRIKMLENVILELPFLSKPGTFLCAEVEYEARANKNGAISALCDNGEWLGVKPGEFEFVKAPEWVVRIHDGLQSGAKMDLPDGE